MDPEHRIETVAVHSGEPRPAPEGSVVFPIYQGTVFEFDESKHDLRYIRYNSTPTQRYLHDKLAGLEGTEAALATGSGMAALTATLLTFLRPGDHFLAVEGLYGGTYDFITRHADELGMKCTFVDGGRPETWEAARKPNTRMFLVETITNPLMRVPRLREVVAFAREQRVLSLIDNTFATPVNFRPLQAGFDLSFHSASKYLNGHSDLVAGCVLGSQAHIDRVRGTLNLFGGTLDPHAGFLLARGLKTLALRVRAQNAVGMALAGFLASQAKESAVNYPGLESHPDHGHARKMLAGFGGMLSIRLLGGLQAVERLFAALEVAYVATSLGGVETLVIRPAVTSHAGMDPEERRRVGVTDDLVRISCGIEHPEDLIEDFRRALEKV